MGNQWDDGSHDSSGWGLWILAGLAIGVLILCLIGGGR